jgi:uncharacterized protein YmfQ (DUF2313 family)
MAMICPSDEAVASSIAATRPRGSAWRNGGHDALAASGMGQFFTGLGKAFGPTHRRICALVEEFFCATARETLPEWSVDYASPDACDPFADICEKVNAVGDSTTRYAIGVAARRGWSITIREEWIVVTQDAAFGPRCFGAAIYGAQQGVAWLATVDLAASPAYVAAAGRPPLYGMHVFGDAFACPPDIEPLKCLIRRIAPAHADITFTTING